VLGLDHHADPLWRQVILQPVGDLLGQPLLHLQITGEQLDHPRQLGQPEDPIARQVADVRDALERQHVVLAQRLDRDVAGQHEFVVALVVRERGQVELARCQHLGVCVRHPARGVGQVVAVRVPAERLEQIRHRSLRRGQVDPRPAPHHVQLRRRDGFAEFGSDRCHLRAPPASRSRKRSVYSFVNQSWR
jgi:hypothetical protein